VTEKFNSAQGVRVSVSPLVEPLIVPLTVTVLFDATVLVPNVTVAVVPPAGMVTVDGAPERSAPFVGYVSETTAPPDAACDASVTISLPLVPPVSVWGEKLTDERYGGLIVNVVDTPAPASEAVIVDAVLDTTGVVVMVNVVDEAPAGTTPGPTTTAALALLVTATVVAAAATPVSVTVPVDEVPPAAALGER